MTISIIILLALLFFASYKYYKADEKNESYVIENGKLKNNISKVSADNEKYVTNISSLKGNLKVAENTIKQVKDELAKCKGDLSDLKNIPVSVEAVSTDEVTSKANKAVEKTVKAKPARKPRAKKVTTKK